MFKPISFLAVFLWCTLLSHSICTALVVPNLDSVARQIFGTKLNFKIAVGSQETPFQMQGLTVALGSNKRTDKKASTGIHEVVPITPPYFVNDKGMQDVNLISGGWELCWNPKSPNGFMVCSFIAPEDFRRSDEAEGFLEAGRFFMQHRVWTEETLKSERLRRKEIQDQAQSFLADRDKKIEKIVDDGSNTLSKIVSYGQAAQSMDKFYKSGYKESLFVPYYDDQVLRLSDDCIMSTRGLIFKASNGKMEQTGESRVGIPTDEAGEKSDQ